MRVTALGVNSAFARGTYTEVYDAAALRQWLSEFQRNPAHLQADDLAGVEPPEWRNARQRVYLPKWQSNFLLEFDAPGKVREDVFRLVIDCGGDIRHSLAGVGLGLADIDAWYVSHPHNDHIGGIEGIALSTLFHPAYTPAKRRLLADTIVTNYVCEHDSLPPECKPDLMGHASVLEETWEAANPGLRTIQGIEEVRLDTYFHPRPLKSNKNYSMPDRGGDWKFYTIVTTHVVAGRDLMPSYGLMFESSNGKHRIYFPTDTQLFMPPQVRHFYDNATVVYMDCETGFVSGVHPHITGLRELPPELKQKMWLYHYDSVPQYDAGEFRGTLHMGDVHEYGLAS